jgi:hypothetical protein
VLYSRKDPVIHPTLIADLRPTQMTVGMREVERKRKAWDNKGGAGKVHTLATHMVPIVLGPDGARYVTDHHHLARALLDDGQKEVYVIAVGDLSKADPAYFWNLMDYHGWTHPYDQKGRRCDYAELPKTVKGLKDDPFRSLAGELRGMGGFAKDVTPFSEFVWADFLRNRIKHKALDDFDEALKQAFVLAKSAEADFLPGWCGPHSDGPKAAAKPAAPKKARRKTAK